MKTEQLEVTKPQKRKKKRWLPRIIYFFFALFIIIDLFLFFLATPILKSFLQDKVKAQTKGLFSVNFDRISIELGTRRVVLEKFELTPDTLVYNDLIKYNKTNAALYKISCGSVELWRLSVYNLMFKSRLYAKNLKLIKPVVELKKLPGKNQTKGESRDFVHEDLFPAIEPYLSEIRINTISLENGQFQLSLKKDSIKTTTHMGHVSVKLYDFLLNKAKFNKHDKLFYANELQIDIEDYKINLSDKIHFLFADNISISTRESKLLASNVGISTIKKASTYNAYKKNNFYRISSPQIEFSNFDIYNLYFNNDIKIGNISFNSPDIEVVNILKIDSTKEDNINKTLEIDLSKLIKGKLHSITVDTFKVQNGKLKFYYDHLNNNPVYKSNSISLGLYNFQIDEKANNDKSKIFYSSNIDILIDTFTAVLPDKTHLMKIDRINVSTKEGKLEATSISVRNLLNTRLKPIETSLNINIPALKVSGSDFFQLYHNRIFNISELSIGKSDISIGLPISKLSEKENAQKKSLLSIITTNFLKELNIYHFVFNTSSFKIRQSENDSLFLDYKGQAFFELNKFSISDKILASNDSKLFYSENFDLKLSNYSQELKGHVHILESKNLEISTKDSLIELDGFSIRPRQQLGSPLFYNSKNKAFNFSLIQAFIRDIDINRSFKDTSLVAGSISIFRPTINIDNYYQAKLKTVIQAIDVNDTTIKINKKLRKSIKSEGSIINFLASYFKKVDINALTIEKADLSMLDIDSLGNSDMVMSGKLSAKLNKFYFDAQNESELNQITQVGNISFRLNDYFAKIANKNYQVKIKEASFSSRDSAFLARIVRIFPTDEYSKSELSNNFFTFYSPEIRTKKSKIEEFLDNNILDMGNLHILNPAIALNVKNRAQVKKIRNDKDSVAEKIGFNKLKLGGIDIENGVFGIVDQANNREINRLHTDLNLHINGFEIDSNVLKQPLLFFDNLGVLANLSNFHYQLKDSLKWMDIDKLELNTIEKSIKGNNLKFNNNEGFSNIKGNTAVKEVFVPEFSFTDFDLGKLVVNKSLNASELDLGNPFINIYSLENKVEKKPFKLADLNLFEKLKKSLNSIEVKSLKFDSASVKVSKLESNKIKIAVFDKIYANITNLIIDSLHQNDLRILNSDDISIGIKNYGLNISDSLYNFTIGDMGFSTREKSFFAESVNLNPNYLRDEYSRIKLKEFSLSYIHADKVTTNGVNFVDLIDNRQFKASNIDLYRIKFQSYKNKQYDMDSVIKMSLPLDYIYKSKNLIQIDSLNIHDSYMGYEMLGNNAIESGIMDFTKINGSITNITNNRKAIVNNEETVFKASGYMLNKSLLSASMHFPLGPTYGNYYYGGTLDTFDMREINPLLENLYFVSITDGIIHHINFNVTANEDYSVGNLQMDYDNLKVDLISKKKSDSLQIENRGLFSMVANSIVRDSNPKRRAGFLKEGSIYFERNIYKPVFNYWSLSPLSGIKSTLGFKSKQLKDRLKVEKESGKFEKKNKRKTRRKDYQTNKNREKQLQKELKELEKTGKKEQKKDRKSQKSNPIAEIYFEKPKTIIEQKIYRVK